MGSGTHGASANGCRQLLPIPVEALVTCGIPKDIVLSVYDRLLSAQTPARRSSEPIDDATHGSSHDAIQSGNEASQDQSRGSLSDVSQRVSDATPSPSQDLPPYNIYSGSDATNGGSCDSINRNITATTLFLAVEAAWRSEWRGHWQDHQLVLSPVNDHQENIVGHWALRDLQDDGEINHEHTSSDFDTVQQQQQAAIHGDHGAEIDDSGVSATTRVDLSEENTATTSTETRTAVAEPTVCSTSTSDLSHTPAISPTSVGNPTAMGHVPSPSSAPTEHVMDITDEINLVRTESHQTVSSLTTSIPKTEGVPTPMDQPQTSTSLLLSPRRDVHEFPPAIHSAAAVTTTNSASMPTSTPTTEPQSPTTTSERERNPSINKSGERRRKLERLRALRSENKRLKARQMCRHCHVRPVSLTLLPCGHFCFCQECGSTFTACPVCRKTILADVRTFVS